MGSSFQFYTGGVLTSNNCGTALDHGVLVVGYGSESGSDFYKVKTRGAPLGASRATSSSAAAPATTVARASAVCSCSRLTPPSELPSSNLAFSSLRTGRQARPADDRRLLGSPRRCSRHLGRPPAMVGTRCAAERGSAMPRGVRRRASDAWREATLVE